VIAGLSLGGVMSLAFHLAHPDRVRALMLFDTGPGFRNPEARRQWNERAEVRARISKPRGSPIRPAAPRRGSAVIDRPSASPALPAACWPNPTAR